MQRGEGRPVLRNQSRDGLVWQHVGKRGHSLDRRQVQVAVLIVQKGFEDEHHRRDIPQGDGILLSCAKAAR